MAYATLWAVVLYLFRHAAKLQEGTYTVNEARVSDTLMLFAAGLFCVAIGLPFAVLSGKSRKAAPIAFGCFVFGFLAIPVLVALLVLLGSLGVLDLD